MAATFGSNCHAQAGKTATDHQHVCVDNLHLMDSLIRMDPQKISVSSQDSLQ